MKDRPVIVHDLDDARAAVAAAAEFGLASLTLRSAPDAARYLGASVYRDIVRAACRAYPGVAVTAVFDCGADPGLALGALRHGLKVIRLSVAGKARDRIADIAAQSGARLDNSDADQPALDLLDAEDRGAALRTWLTAAD
ncbi:MAG: hypothetical protein HYW28_10095 [Rhodospirillales bacterium]|nr:hypothetical protein [Rhodospirillales bacterium]MBI2586200.1 hypothetical protein [Rhodospirillales bacterium]MBI2978952.1 hypothetical protein [Rhodospirillales bacterium]